MAVNVDSDVFLVFVISHCMLGCSCFKVRSIGWPLCLFLFFSSVNLKFNRNQTASVKSAWYKSRCVIFHLTTTKDRERESVCVTVLFENRCWESGLVFSSGSLWLSRELIFMSHCRSVVEAHHFNRRDQRLENIELGYVSWKPAYAVYSQQRTS